MSLFGTYVQIFAAFIDKKNIVKTPMNECLSMIEKYNLEIEKNRDIITPVKSSNDLKMILNRGGLYSILSIEGGEALEGTLSAIYMYYKLGVRLITLTWNWANEIADGICESRGGGLTDFGIQAVKLMEELGIVIDVSHLSEKGFWDVAKTTSRPFVASHSCVKAICQHKRNLNDEQIKEIILRKGCIGINYFPDFLTEKTKCDYFKIVDHISYILAMDGENSVGLGSDFDGVDYLPQGIGSVEDVYKIITRMKDIGFSQELINKILFDNFYRVFMDILR